MGTGLNARDVLNQLDHDAESEPAFFPDFADDCICHVDGRLSVYANGDRWVLIIEQLGVHPRVGACGGGIQTTLYYHGNSIVLDTQSGWGDQIVHTLELVSDGPSGPLLLEDSLDEIRVGARDLRIRDEVIPIRTDAGYYWARKIDVEAITHEQIDEMIRDVASFVPPDEVERRIRSYEEMRQRVGRFELRTWHLARGLVPEYRELLLSTDFERRKSVPEDLKLFLQIDDWDHPRLSEGELPSERHSFRLIARALEAGDPSLYRPSRPGNVHWSNWLESESL